MHNCYCQLWVCSSNDTTTTQKPPPTDVSGAEIAIPILSVLIVLMGAWVIYLICTRPRFITTPAGSISSQGRSESIADNLSLLVTVAEIHGNDYFSTDHALHFLFRTSHREATSFELQPDKRGRRPIPSVCSSLGRPS